MLPTGPTPGTPRASGRQVSARRSDSDPPVRESATPVRVAVVTSDVPFVEWVRRALAEEARRYAVFGPVEGPSVEPCRADVVLLEIGSQARRDVRRLLNALRLPVETPLLLVAREGQDLGGLAGPHRVVTDVLRRPSLTPPGLRRSLANALERHRLSKTLSRAVRRERESEANFRALFFQSAQGLLLVDRDGNVSLVNPAAEAILGHDASRLVGKSLPLPRRPGMVREVAVPRPGRRPVPVRVRATELKCEREGRILVSIEDQRGRSRGRRIAAARAVHRGLLPRRLQVRSGRLEAAAWNEYCQDASGDYYDILDLEGGRLGVAVGDVAGHGLDAAVLMAQGRAFLRAYWKAEAGLPRVLEDLNGSMVRDMTRGRFMTLFLAQVELESGALRWCNAGHTSALLFRASTGVLERLESTAPPIGIDADARFLAGSRILLAADDVLLSSTDGVTEARGPGGACFGEGRLSECLRRFAGRRPARIVDGIRSTLAAWRGTRDLEDDLTVAVLKWSRTKVGGDDDTKRGLTAA